MRKPDIKKMWDRIIELRLVYYTVFLKQIRYPTILGFELVSVFNDTTVSSCKVAPICNSGKLNYVNSIILDLKFKSSKKKWGIK